MDDKVTELSQHRAEESKDARDVVAPFLSRCHLGEQRSVVVLGVRTDGTVESGAAIDERDLAKLILEIERIKLRLIED